MTEITLWPPVWPVRRVRVFVVDMKIVIGVGSDTLSVSNGSHIPLVVYANIRVGKGDVEKGDGSDKNGRTNLH